MIPPPPPLMIPPPLNVSPPPHLVFPLPASLNISPPPRPSAHDRVKRNECGETKQKVNSHDKILTFFKTKAMYVFQPDLEKDY